MKIKKIYLLIIGLVIAVGIATGSILAWLTDTDTTSTNTFTVGKVEYTLTPGVLSNGGGANPVVPGQELITTPYKLTNSSTVNSELRVKIEVTYPDPGNPPIDAINLVDITVGTLWGALDNGYYYYDNSGNEVIPDNYVTPIDVLTSLKLKGNAVGNTFSGTVFTITVTFQAKQADHVDWATLTAQSIDFSTGLA